MKDIGAMMKQAGALQAKLKQAQDRLAASSVTGQAGSGLVIVTLSGGGDLTDISVSPSLLSDGDAETLQDLVRAAHAEAKARLDMLQAELMRDAAGPLANLPGFPGLKP
jgi:DNA-binding YbaB/EbfC family protein